LIDKHHNHFEWPLPCPHKRANPRSIPRGEAKSEGKGESRFLSLNQERQEQGEKHAFFVFNQTPAIFLIKKQTLKSSQWLIPLRRLLKKA